MVNLPPVPQIITVTSEALQAKIRSILPSQQGFGADLAAQNVIVPIVDLTAAAAGTDTPTYLQTALNFGGATAFDGTGDIATTPGFYRVTGSATLATGSTSQKTTQITITDGATTKIMWSLSTNTGSATDRAYSESFDYTFFLVAGETLSVVQDSLCRIIGSVRQVATVTGELVNPVGFTPQ